jgi:hypothetical protein
VCSVGDLRAVITTAPAARTAPLDTLDVMDAPDLADTWGVPAGGADSTKVVQA